MKNIYIFSFSNFYIHFNNDIFFVNKNAHCKIADIESTDVLLINQNPYSKNYLELPLTNLKQNNYYRLHENNNTLFIELIADKFDSLCEKYLFDNLEVLIYQTGVRIIKNNNCYSYFFKAENSNYTILYNNSLYIFNNTNTIIFDLNNLSFDYLITEKLQKNAEKIEILCKIPRNNIYFLHFAVNMSQNRVIIKQYKKQLKTSSKLDPICFFYLFKHNFKDSELLLEDKSLMQNIISYFKQYDNIFELNGNYYLCNCKQLTSIKFEIKNDKIIDID